MLTIRELADGTIEIRLTISTGTINLDLSGVFQRIRDVSEDPDLKPGGLNINVSI